MEQVIWCVGHYLPDGQRRLLRDRYCALIQYDNEADARKMALALNRMGYLCSAVPIDLSAENPV